jgi:hypothetical protein
MRLLAPATETPSRFTTVVGQVHTIALKFNSGKLYPSTRPGLLDSVMYTLNDGRRAWFAPEVAKLIDDLRLAPGEPFTIVNHGARRGWEVLRRPATPEHEPEMPPFAPEKAAPAPDTTPAAVVVTGAPATKLEHALKTAIQAAANAEKFSDAIGHPVRFDAEAIRAMAITVLINSSSEARR